MFNKLSCCGAMNVEGSKQDVEKGESSSMPKRPGKAIELTDQGINSEKQPQKNGDKPPNIPIVGEGSCIFMIPQSLKKIHHKGYIPELVSIGPYHHNADHLKMIQEQKHRFLNLFLDNATEKGVTKTDLGNKIKGIENVIRSSYSDDKIVGKLNQDQLIDMMLLDGCFVLMLFFFDASRVSREKSPDDQILNTPYILPTIRSDLLLLENQVPFILLETLFKASNKSSLGLGSLNDLAFTFFNFSMDKPKAYWEKHNQYKAKHLLDLIRKTLIPISSSNGGSYDATKPSQDNDSQSFTRLILSAKRLRLQGIEFKASHDPSFSNGCCAKMFCCLSNEYHAFIPKRQQEETILELQLKGDELQIPLIVFDEFISSVLLNCVAFEQLSLKCSNDVTSYVVFMGCLMSDEVDATYLSEKGIIENYFGNGNDVSQFFKNISSGVAFDMNKSYLKEVFKGINKYTSKRRHVECARFMRLHFDSPWTCMSSAAVLIILLLTIFQATFAALSYLHPPKEPKDKGT
ncbi:unnamed protein product [Microthlaspi erraticum]|uniref:Uncharacterized protein n=1 Tax=Microthlaspi erraticum TaxID=1685480 RepID=A0A6D2KW68_9BRAS|nr:unnamed protein product [Microthlaspi erraticum]